MNAESVPFQSPGFGLLPNPGKVPSNSMTTLKELHLFRSTRWNSFRVRACRIRLPSVARRVGQHWALEWNAVGVQLCRVTRDLRRIDGRKGREHSVTPKRARILSSLGGNAEFGIRNEDGGPMVVLSRDGLPHRHQDTKTDGTKNLIRRFTQITKGIFAVESV